GDVRRVRALADGAFAWSTGEEVGWLDVEGVTGALAITLPFARIARSTMRLDADLVHRELLALRGDLAFRHPCGCLGVDLAAAHRVGRDGVDVIAAVDLTP